MYGYGCDYDCIYFYNYVEFIYFFDIYVYT